METKKRCRIGLMIHHLENEYATEILRGAIQAAEELDVNLILLPGRGINAVEDDEKYSIYDYQYNVIYNYVSSKNIDALIISAGTIASYISHREMLDFLHSFGTLPILTLEVEYPGYPCIHFNKGGMKLAVNYLIQNCGCRTVGFVSGPVGNEDAMERLESYKEALAENNIAYSDKLVAYGNFSEHSDAAVERLLDDNPDIQGICFANDNMCVGGYRVFEKRGLHVGRDIKVTGYDDSEVATSLKPMLTTIRTNVSDMGYHALRSACRLAENGTAAGVNMHAQLIIRDSCGTQDERAVTIEEVRHLAELGSYTAIVFQIFNRYIGGVESYPRTPFLTAVWDLIEQQFREQISGKIMQEAQYIQRIERIFQNTREIQFHLPLLKKILQTVRDLLLALDDKKQNERVIHSTYMHFLDCLLDYSIQQQYLLRSNLVYSNFLISNINKDMMVDNKDEEMSFFSIVRNLYQVHFRSSYVYIFRLPIEHHNYDPWKAPEYVYLKAYHVGEEVRSVPARDQQLPLWQCIENDYIPDDKRHTFILVPLFSNEEQYGLFVCELDINHFSQIYSVAPQICTAIKMNRLVKELEGNLEEARYDNRRLEHISDSDDLTGAYNRRGFYRYANKLLESPDLAGRDAVLLLADLDNLKQINDNFGHGEGDHAIRTCVNYLIGCDPMLQVVGRIGGDEFAALAIVDDAERAMDQIYSSIKRAAKNYNSTDMKPFNISLSIGLHPLRCDPEKRVQSYIKFADDALYQDKRQKALNVIKPGKERKK